MKKTGTTLFLVGLANAVLSQGTVTFQNSGAIFGDAGTPPDRLVYFGEVGGEKLVGTNYAAGLYYTLPGLTNLILVPDAIRLFRLPTTTFPGTWNTQPTATVILPGVPFYHIYTTLQVRVWDIQQFATWEAAMVGGGLHGESNPFPYVPVGANGSPADSTLKSLRAFAVIPEPSVFGLGLLGAGMWWFMRRRERR
jgi:hypothetical protein